MRAKIVLALALLPACGDFTPVWDPKSSMHWASTGNAALDMSLALILILLLGLRRK